MGSAATTWNRLLADELVERKQRNQAYSLRAFARDLGVSASCLSDVLHEKRQLSKKHTHSIAKKLCLSPNEARALREKKEKILSSPHYLTLEEDVFHLVADWYYFAILNLAGGKFNLLLSNSL